MTHDHSDDIKKATEIADEYAQLHARRRVLLGSIADAYKRMATNRDVDYRASQRQKVGDWLEELTKMFEEHPVLWTVE